MRWLNASSLFLLLTVMFLSPESTGAVGAEPGTPPETQAAPAPGPALTASPPAEPLKEHAAEPGTEPSPDMQEAEKPSDAEAGDATETTEPDAMDAPEEAAGAGGKAAEPEQLPELSKEMAAFRDRIRRTLGRYYQQPVSTSTNTADDILHFCKAFGVGTEIRHGNGKINGIGCLCWNYACGGYRLLRAGNEGIVPRIGYGFQTRPSQLLAMLGQTAVPETYELRVDERQGTVADLVEYEKRTCREGTDQSLKLVGLAFYVRDGAAWKSDTGEEWSVERLLKSELDRTVPLDDRAATDHLLGLTYALQRRERSGQPLSSEYERAQKFLADFHRHALSVQNSDGSWNPKFFTLKGTSRDTMGSLHSTGHILHWLSCSLPADQLQTAEVIRGVHYLNTNLEGMLSRWSFTSAPPQDVSTVAHAIGALMTYDRHVFHPHDAKEPPASAAPPANKQARSAAPAAPPAKQQERSAVRPQSTRRAAPRRR